MEVKVISNTIQQFNGESFYLCGQYYQRKGRRLHREVWLYHNGEIPKGYHVHHIDGNRSHNDISNLALVQGVEHLRGHMSAEERKAQSRLDVKKAIAAAPEWHHSKEGRAWHSERGKKNWELRELNTYKCSFCGKEFQTKHIYGENENHFCHPNCKAAFRRRRLRDEG